jgi:hypothetical protein
LHKSKESHKSKNNHTRIIVSTYALVSWAKKGTVFGEFGEGNSGALGGGAIGSGRKGNGLKDIDMGEDLPGQVPASLAGLDDENLVMLALVFELSL